MKAFGTKLDWELRQRLQAEGAFSVLGDADNVFRATSVERERNYTSSGWSDQNSMVISCDERRAGAKRWWGPFEAPSVPN